MLSILLCVKQVPDTGRALFDLKTGSIDRASAENIVNPDDLHALETALSIRDTVGARITALSMGPPGAREALYEAAAYGADRCVLLCDPRFAGSDSLATSRALAAAIIKTGPFDLIITGREAIDGSTGHVGYQLSEILKIPLVTRIHAYNIEGRYITIERLYGHEYQKIRASLPLILSVGREDNRVRFLRLADIAVSSNTAIEELSMDDIGGREDEYGITGSPTVVVDTRKFNHTRSRESIEGGATEKARAIVQRLKKHGILQY